MGGGEVRRIAEGAVAVDGERPRRFADGYLWTFAAEAVLENVACALFLLMIYNPI